MSTSGQQIHGLIFGCGIFHGAKVRREISDKNICLLVDVITEHSVLTAEWLINRSCGRELVAVLLAGY